MQRLSSADPSVAGHLRAQKVDAQFFAFRWMTTLFAQDVDDMATIQRIWDFLLGDAQGCKEAMMRFCSALILVRTPTCLLVLSLDTGCVA
jgi:Rab-GTPase-TBC domain